MDLGFSSELTRKKRIWIIGLSSYFKTLLNIFITTGFFFQKNSALYFNISFSIFFQFNFVFLNFIFRFFLTIIHFIFRLSKFMLFLDYPSSLNHVETTLIWFNLKFRSNKKLDRDVFFPQFHPQNIFYQTVRLPLN
jgi:hypothetical protein